MNVQFLRRNKIVILYGISLALLLFLLKWLELRFIIFQHAFEFYIAAIAIVFTTLGIWLSRKLTKPRIEKVIVEKLVTINHSNGFVLNETAAADLNISKRELEVLELMANGYSNQEIAGQLFVSLNTIKTHSSRVFEKLDVKRRTQAVEKARKLCLIP